MCSSQYRLFTQCSHCRFFIPDTREDYITSKHNKCGYFGKRNLITGEFIPNDVIENRMNDTRCGIRGIYFEKNQYAPFSLFYAKAKIKIASFLRGILQRCRMTQEELVLAVFLVPYFFFTVIIGILILKSLY
jgi:hypothetical protein